MKLDFKQLFEDIYRLMDPRNIGDFFEKLPIKPVKEVLYYLLFLSLFTLVGYTLRYGFFSEPKYLEIALKISLLYSLVGIYVPTGVISLLVMSYLFQLEGKKLVKREVSQGEALSIIGYASIPGLVGGFFGILMETQILHILLIGYSIYLLYAGIKIRFGFKFALRAFIFVIFSGFICSMLLFILGAILLGIPGQYYGVG